MSRLVAFRSHPAVAGKPFVLHPGLLPVVISFSALAPVEYKNGFRKPSGRLPAAMSGDRSAARRRSRKRRLSCSCR